MLVKVTAKRQVTFPKHVLDALGVGPGDQLELRESAEALRNALIEGEQSSRATPFDFDAFIARKRSA